MSSPVISVRGLRKAYGSGATAHQAVGGIDLEINRGEIFAFLGPNGAGKTTTVEILEGYRDRDAGETEVLGIDPADGDSRWRSRIGIVLQECRMEPKLTVRETLELYAGLYQRPREIDETIELVGLGEKANDRAESLSGGQQRRLDVAVALIGDAELLFLDEPTTGFDPGARRQAWEVIAGLRDLGKTIFLTTHYMDEAQALADRVAVIADGAIVAQGTPDDLGGRATAATEIRFARPVGVEPSELPTVVGSEWSSAGAGLVRANTVEPTELLHRLTGWALGRGVELRSLEVSRPSLEDIYLELTAAEGREGARHAGGDHGRTDAGERVGERGRTDAGERVGERSR
ncbi:MAG: ATP-binding cassette domain-containing protein [Solirubrobacterales bacterium]